MPRLSRLLWTLLALFAALGLLPLLMQWDPYWLMLFSKLYINAMFGVSMWPLFVIGRLTLAHGAFLGIGAYGVALATLKLGWSFWLALPLTVVLVVLIALAFALPSLRVYGAQFTMCTFAFAEVFRLTYLGFKNPFGGAEGLLNIPMTSPLSLPFLPTIEFGDYLTDYYLVFAFLVVMTLVYYRFVHSYLGLLMRSIHDAAHVSRTLGVDVYKLEVTTFVLTAAGAGVAGSLYAVWAQYIEPNIFGFIRSIDAQAYVIIGGSGNALGPLLGAAFMTLMPEYFRLAREVSPIITGAALISAMLFFNGGFVTLPSELRRLVRKLAKGKGDAKAGAQGVLEGANSVQAVEEA